MKFNLEGQEDHWAPLVQELPPQNWKGDPGFKFQADKGKFSISSYENIVLDLFGSFCCFHPPVQLDGRIQSPELLLQPVGQAMVRRQLLYLLP